MSDFLPRPDQLSKPSDPWRGLTFYYVTAAVFFIAYVFLYPVYAILDYFRFINSDHGVGHVLYIVYMPLAYLEMHSETVSAFFKWLKELYTDPFFGPLERP
ncbi:hypothetical protein [Prosthecobacter sp.]|uniref:hypothetical protein n=1 Tax=Prosthecobacter sp. TaxID=1965333 RepID=UPI003784ECA1